MNKPARIASHLVAIAIGIALAAFGSGIPNRDIMSATPESPPSRRSITSENRGNPTTNPSRTTRSSLKSGDFKLAWEAVAARGLSKENRQKLQSQILREWAQVDLRAALDAAMNQAWDDDSSDPFRESYFLTPFSQAFRDRPLDAWELIESGRYGLVTQKLRGQWVDSVSGNNGELLVSMLSKIPRSLQQRAILMSLQNRASGPDRGALLAKIVEQAGNEHDDWLQVAIKYLPLDEDTAALRERWGTIPEGAERKIAMLKWGASLVTADEGKISSELAAIPPDARDGAARALLSQFDEDVPGVLAALDFAVGTDAWSELSKSGVTLLQKVAQTGEIKEEKLVEWANRLPEGPDTAKLYQTAVARFIGQDMDRAKGWLVGMEDGSWQRENSLTEFSKLALREHSDKEASQWAIDSISDPQTKAAAIQWRLDWEERGGDR